MCLAHYTQPHPCFGQLPKNCDLPWWREGLTQGENRVTGRVIMLGGYFSQPQRKAEDMFACLLIHPSEKITAVSMTSNGLQPQLFPPFYVMHLNPPTSSFSLTRLQQISTVRGAIWKEKINAPLPSVKHCNCEACQVKVKQKPWAVVTDSLRGTVVSASRKKWNVLFWASQQSTQRVSDLPHKQNVSAKSLEIT